MIRIRSNRDATPAMFLGVFFVGVLALYAGWFQQYEPRVMYGIATGCITTGAIGVALATLARRWVSRNRPDLLRKEQNAQDERAVQIRHQAGYSVMWALFAYFFIYTLLSPTELLQNVSHQVFGSVTLILISLAYWAALCIYSRKY